MFSYPFFATQVQLCSAPHLPLLVADGAVLASHERTCVCVHAPYPGTCELGESVKADVCQRTFSPGLADSTCAFSCCTALNPGAGSARPLAEAANCAAAGGAASRHSAPVCCLCGGVWSSYVLTTCQGRLFDEWWPSYQTNNGLSEAFSPVCAGNGSSGGELSQE